MTINELIKLIIGNRNIIDELVQCNIKIISAKCIQVLDDLLIINSLLNVNISRLPEILKVYYYYNIYNMILLVEKPDHIIELMMKYSNLNIGQQCKTLFAAPELPILAEYLIKDLLSIIRDYYDLLDRNTFLNKLSDLYHC